VHRLVPLDHPARLVKRSEALTVMNPAFDCPVVESFPLRALPREVLQSWNNGFRDPDMMPWCAKPDHPCSNGATSNRPSLRVRWAGICDSPFPIETLRNFLTERGIPADHTTVWRWVQRYAPELNKRCRRELRPTNGSWRVDETYIRAKGKWVYLYRAVDSTGATIDFLLAAHRDAAAAKRFFQKALRASGHPRPRVINVDGNPSYPKVVAELRAAGELARRCRCRTCPYLNNIVEQDHRAI